MKRKLISGLIAGAVILAPGAALAAHGKPGLWTITSTMHMASAPQMPPGMAEMMKKRGTKMPMADQPFTSQMCMTQEEVNADKPPRMTSREINCDTKILSQSASSMKSETVCHGVMDGVGHSEINWTGNEHYRGSYNFKGTMHGQPNEMNTTYKGDWIGADCGAVKPFTAKAMAH
ncbi:MAG TPA: DUF3617 domain-containing protein [Rhizomicrobium sp.]|nr:DUF3617 domain-containing protein [Rhizomicrobium sp.]